MNIRRTLSIATLVISSALFMTGGQLLLNRYTEISEKKKLVAALDVLSALDDALIKMSLERSVVQVTSNLQDPIAPEFRKLLDDQRIKVDAAFAQARENLKINQDILVKPKYIEDTITDTTSQLKMWREKADAQISQPLSARDINFIKQWPVEVPKIIEKAAGKRVWLNIQAQLIPPRIIALQDAKYHLWRIREFGGRDRTYMAIAAARQEPLPSFFIDKMVLLEGPVNRSRVVLSDMQNIGMFEEGSEIPEILKTAEEIYFGEYSNLRAAFLEAGKAGKLYSISFSDFFKQSSQALDSIEKAHEKIGQKAKYFLHESSGNSHVMLIFYAICIIVTTLLSIYVQFYVSQRVGRRLQDLTSKTERISLGDYNVDLKSLERKDEIGTLAKATEVLRDNSARAKQLEEETRAFEQKSKEDQRLQTLALADSFEQKIGSVSVAVSEVASSLQQAAHSLTEVAQHTAEQANAASTGSSQTSQNVQTVASATEELSASVGEINRQVSEATRITARAVDQAQKTDATIQGLAHAAKRIDEVVGLINAIASQTNLLALNATIEAARAGEAGKGFAVVASEVKSLAQETARATEDIATQVASIQDETEKAVQAIKDIGLTIEEVNRIATVIATAVDQQGAATQEISRNVQSAALVTNEVSGNVENVRQGASETTRAANDLQSASAEVSRQGALLSSEMDKLLKHLRAA